MRRLFRVLIFSLLAIVLVLGGLVLWAYFASQREPEFYQRALKIQPQTLAVASDQMLRQATELYSEVQTERRWDAVFTAEQINGWLAVDLERNHPNTLPKEVSDPRVAISPDGVVLACRYESDSIATVFSLRVDVYLAKPNVVALRFKHARAGSLPLPLNRVLEGVSEAALKLNLPLHWQQAEGDPVALVEIPPPVDEHDASICVESLQLRDGALYLAGKTVRSNEPATAAVNQSPTQRKAQR